MLSRAFWSVVVVCAFLPGTGRAQPSVGIGAGFGNYGYPYGPLVGPPWGYYGGPGGLYAGPPGYYGGFGYGYGGFGYPGFFGYSGRAGSFWSNGLSLYGPPVPVPGSIPGVWGNSDLVEQWRSTLAPGYAAYGVGIYVTLPRLRYHSVTVVEPVSAPTAAAPKMPDKVGGSMIISVKVPQPAAEVFVNGKRTGQHGIDRIFLSPPLEAGKTHTITVTVRWFERGQVIEMSQEATGTPGEVVRLDFSR